MMSGTALDSNAPLRSPLTDINAAKGLGAAASDSVAKTSPAVAKAAPAKDDKDEVSADHSEFQYVCTTHQLAHQPP